METEFAAAQARRSAVPWVLPTFLLLLLSLLAPRTTEAQIIGGGGGWFAMGRGHLAVDEMNDYLEAAGEFPALSSTTLHLGGGGYALFGRRFLIGGEGAAWLGEDSRNAAGTTSVGGAYGQPFIGYVVYSDASRLVFPVIGLGRAWLSVEARNAAAQTTTLESDHLTLDLSLGAQQILGWGNAEGKGGFLVGIRAGYVHSFASAEWKLDPTARSLPLPGIPPKLGMTGPYVQITIGGGGFALSGSLASRSRHEDYHEDRDVDWRWDLDGGDDSDPEEE